MPPPVVDEVKGVGLVGKEKKKNMEQMGKKGHSDRIKMTVHVAAFSFHHVHDRIGIGLAAFAYSRM